MAGDCETGGPHHVEEFTDGELRCVECCRTWAPLELAWKLRDALRLILPQAKAWAHEHPVGANQSNVDHARRALEEG
jgi:hypothetical protein